MSDDSAISPAPVIEAYCVKCRIKREIQHAQFVFNVRGQPVTRGACPVCGTTLFRLGDTAGHAGLTRPAPVKIEKPAQPAAAAPAGPTSAPAGLPADASAYCVKCKTRRPLGEAQAVFTARGVRAVRGACPVCGTTLFRMGDAPGHRRQESRRRTSSQVCKDRRRQESRRCTSSQVCKDRRAWQARQQPPTRRDDAHPPGDRRITCKSQDRGAHPRSQLPRARIGGPCA